MKNINRKSVQILFHEAVKCTAASEVSIYTTRYQIKMSFSSFMFEVTTTG